MTDWGETTGSNPTDVMSWLTSSQEEQNDHQKNADSHSKWQTGKKIEKAAKLIQMELNCLKWAAKEQTSASIQQEQ